MLALLKSTEKFFDLISWGQKSKEIFGLRLLKKFLDSGFLWFGLLSELLTKLNKNWLFNLKLILYLRDVVEREQSWTIIYWD